MKLKSYLKTFVPFLSALLVASCSNIMQPLPVDSGTGNNTTAAISDLTVRDMGWAGGQLWAVSRSSKGSDYYLARYSSSSNQWQVLTSYWGLRCAVSNSGKCYHVNAAGQLWWVTRNSNGTYSSQWITTLPANKNANDIGAGTYDGQDRIWVRFMDNSGNYTVSYADYSGSGNSVVGGVDGWTQVQVWGNNPKCVSADPYNGFTGAGLGSTNTVNFWDPDAHGNDVPYLNCNLVDIATCDGKFIIVTDDQKLYAGNGLFSWTTVNTFAKTSVSMTKISGVIYVMYINSSNRIQYVTFNSLID